MKNKLAFVKDLLVRNKWFVIGFLLVTFVLFSHMLLGYKLSFTNVNYTFAPFNSTQTATRGPLLSDVADHVYPSIYRLFYSGEGLGLWENDVALGITSDSISQVMNPSYWVYVLPLDLAISLKYFFEFLLGFFGMFMFMRSLGAQKYAAALTGLIYTFSSVIIVWLGWAHSDVAVWAPLLFFAIERLISTVKVSYMFLIAFVIYMMLIVGMPTYAAYFMYLAGLYIVIFTVKHHWKQKKNIVMIGVMFAIAVIIAAVATLPYTITVLESTVANGYSDSRAAYGEAKLSWGYLRTILFPYPRDNLPMHINESTLFVGMAAPLLLPLGLFGCKSKKRNIFFLASSAVLFLLIFTDVLNVIYTRLPVISTSLKFRVIVLLMFTLSIVTGLTINDVFTNRDYYKKKPWIVPLLAVWIGGIYYLAGKDLIEPHTKLIVAFIGLGLMMVACVLYCIYFQWARKLVTGAFAVLIMLEGSIFAAVYLPWVDADSPTIPQPTDSVAYMMKGTDNQERIAGLGTWTLFPNTPTYYGLNDIRTHGFEATNADMRTYYETIDPKAYVTNTRTQLLDIQNYDLLKYLGVKYLYGENLSGAVAVGDALNNTKVFGNIRSRSTLTQSVTFTESPRAVSVLFATHGTTPSSNSDITLQLVSPETQKVVFTSVVPISTVKDNGYVHFLMGEDTPVAAGTYTLTLSFGDLKTDTLTVWMKESPDLTVTDGEKTENGSMMITAVYSEDCSVVFCGQDGLVVSKLNEYADKVQLVEHAQVFATNEDVLKSMSEKYVDNAALLVGNDASAAYDRPLTKKENVTLAEYDDDYVKIICTSEYDRYVVLNDYYNADWVAYVNGVEVPIEKVNYMMRAVKVTSGQDMVIEFKYRPVKLYAVIGISAATIVLTVVAFVLRRRLQKLVDKLCAVKERIDTK